MAVPTSGYSGQTAHYLIASSAGFQFSIDVGLTEAPVEAEELLPFLDAALAEFQSAYAAGTAHTAAVTKVFTGSTTPVVV